MINQGTNSDGSISKQQAFRNMGGKKEEKKKKTENFKEVMPENLPE